MRQIKYTEEMVAERCDEQELDFVEIGHVTDKSGRKRKVVSFICKKHRHLGLQQISVEKIFETKVVCSYCNHKKLKYVFRDEVKRMNDTVEVLSEYYNWNTHINCRCLICGNEWATSPASLLQGCGCPKCGMERSRLTRINNGRDLFIKMVKYADQNIIIRGEYTKAHENVLCECAIDGTTWETTPARLKRNESHCPTCTSKRLSESQSMGRLEFINRLNDINNQIELVGEYISAHQKTEFFCKKHRLSFIAEPAKFLYRNKRGCPKCSSSLGENEMCRILDKLGVEYVRQETFDDCKNITALKYDAYSESIKTAFEFQGGQHYFPVDFAGKGKEWAEENLRINQYRDSIKREYCKEHNIRLIEIPYWEFDNGNMENYIREQLKIA